MNKSNEDKVKDFKNQEEKIDVIEDEAAGLIKKKFAKRKSVSPKSSKELDEIELAAVEARKALPVAIAAKQGEISEFIEKVISINRITKVTKGGKKLSFSALVVVGDAKGKVGYSLSKAKEVSIAIRKAMGVAKNNMVRIPMKGTTIPHEIIGACGGSRVLLKPASDGTGIIAAGPVRAVCDGAGIRNILTKCHRSNNPINVVKATMDGLMRLKSA
ncbi:MAG TPA: 30S ribosomal protein S5 [Candidatus Omnitrophica bacterium]|nr:30S ribosomal protein S5 [Candidatus Omnitrophota bacterium]